MNAYLLAIGIPVAVFAAGLAVIVRHDYRDAGTDPFNWQGTVPAAPGLCSCGAPHAVSPDAPFPADPVPLPAPVIEPRRYDGTDPGLPGGWVHDDGTPCPEYLAPDNGTRWWCTTHEQYLRRPDGGTAPVIEPGAITSGPPGEPQPGACIVVTVTRPGGQITSVQYTPGTAGYVDEQIRTGMGLPPWVAEELGHDSTDDALDSMFNRAMARQVRALTDGAS